jgi:hypothetical protein
VITYFFTYLCVLDCIIGNGSWISIDSLEKTGTLRVAAGAASVAEKKRAAGYGGRIADSEEWNEDAWRIDEDE